MTSGELKALIHDVNSDVVRIARALATRAEVRREIQVRAQAPLEEQLIDEDAFGVPTGGPKVVSVYGTQLRIWKLHRAGLLASDIKGADLYYEIENEKFVLIQYKTPSANGRVSKDQTQLEVLRSVCPQRCNPSNRFVCGSWFALRDREEGSYFPACEASNVFGSKASRKKSAFVNGLSKSQFQEDFAACLIGGRTEPIGIENVRLAAMMNDKILFQVEHALGAAGA